MRFGSVCSGIEASSVAWEPLGWECAFVSEIAAFPCAVQGGPAKDGPRYQALGNSMAVPVMRWIGARIELVEAIVPKGG